MIKKTLLFVLTQSRTRKAYKYTKSLLSQQSHQTKIPDPQKC